MGEFEAREAAESLKRQREDFADFQDEMAGRDTGKRVRFVRDNEDRTEKGRDKKRAQETATQLQALLANPSYAAAYTQTKDLLIDAERRTQEAIDRAEDVQAQAEADLSNLEESANTLPDGTRVYRAEDGTWRNEDGEEIKAPEADTVVEKEGAPSYEDYLAQKKRADDAQQRLDDLRRYQIEVLGVARDRMEDPENPPTEVEMEKIRCDIQDGLDTVVEPPTATKSMELAQTANTLVPNFD